MGMLFYTFLFDALKQAWAMAFLCFAFDSIFKNKPIRFIVFVGVATFFHFPALVFLPAYWIAKLKINRMFPIIMIAVFVFVFVFRTQLLNWMDSTYGSGESNYETEVQFIGTKVVFMIILLAYGFYLYFKYNYDTRKDGKLFSTLIFFIGIATVIQTFCYYNNIFERLADYYYHFSILFLPLILFRKDEYLIESKSVMTDSNSITSPSTYVLSREKTKTNSFASVDVSLILTIIVVLFCVFRFCLTMINHSNLSPYYFFWQNQ